MGTGSCNCGRCQYRFSAEFEFCSYCHCSICQKLSGSAFSAYGALPAAAFQWTGNSATPLCYRPGPDTRRFFCGTCGSFLLTTHVLAPEMVYLSLGCITQGAPDRIDYEQFTGSRVPWHQPNIERQYTQWCPPPPKDKES